MTYTYYKDRDGEYWRDNGDGTMISPAPPIVQSTSDAHREFGPLTHIPAGHEEYLRAHSIIRRAEEFRKGMEPTIKVDPEDLKRNPGSAYDEAKDRLRESLDRFLSVPDPPVDHDGNLICPECRCRCNVSGCPEREDCDNECWCERGPDGRHRECTGFETDAGGNCKCGCGYNSEVAYSAGLMDPPEPTTFHPGDRVRGKYNGLFGTMVSKEASAHYVWVKWDCGPNKHNPAVGVGTDKLELISRPEPTGWKARPEGGVECRVCVHCEVVAPGNPPCLNCVRNASEPTEYHPWGCGAVCVCSPEENPARPLNHTPATDPIGTVRVHPDDDPEDPNARRAWKVDRDDPDVPWIGDGQEWLCNDEVTDWTRQPLTDVARVLGHPDAGRVMRMEADLLAERQNLKVQMDRTERLERERDEWKQCADQWHGGFLARLRERDEMEEYAENWQSRAESAETQAERLERELEQAQQERDDARRDAHGWRGTAEAYESGDAHRLLIQERNSLREHIEKIERERDKAKDSVRRQQVHIESIQKQLAECRSYLNGLYQAPSWDDWHRVKRQRDEAKAEAAIAKSGLEYRDGLVQTWCDEAEGWRRRYHDLRNVVRMAAGFPPDPDDSTEGDIEDYVGHEREELRKYLEGSEGDGQLVQ